MSLYVSLATLPPVVRKRMMAAGAFGAVSGLTPGLVAFFEPKALLFAFTYLPGLTFGLVLGAATLIWGQSSQRQSIVGVGAFLVANIAWQAAFRAGWLLIALQLNTHSHGPSSFALSLIPIAIGNLLMTGMLWLLLRRLRSSKLGLHTLAVGIGLGALLTLSGDVAFTQGLGVWLVSFLPAGMPAALAAMPAALGVWQAAMAACLVLAFHEGELNEASAATPIQTSAAMDTLSYETRGQ